MELLKFSKFKLHLQTLIAEVQDLREREQSANEQLQQLIQRQKRIEEEYGRKLQDLEVQLVSSNEMRQKLERKVNFLQNDNSLLENKEKELKATIHNLLQSRENFVNVYKESTAEMKFSIEARDRKLAILSEKINSHLLLYDSIEKEAFSIKQVVDNVQHVVHEKEELVAGLKSKMDKVSAFEKLFIGKICDLEKKVINGEDELRKKNKIISELEAQLEAAKITNNYQPQMAELQRNLSAKDAVIQNLIFEKEALHLEVGNLGLVLKKIQDTVMDMNEEDKRVFASLMERQEGCEVVTTAVDNRTEDAVPNSQGESPNKVSYGSLTEKRALPHSLEYKTVDNLLQENNNLDSCVSESACSEPQSAANVCDISMNKKKDNCTSLEHQLDSECSTTQAPPLDDPGKTNLTMHK